MAEKLSELDVFDLQRSLLDLAKNINKQRKIPKLDKYAGTPLDTSPEFQSFLEACRRGDIKSCHEYIVKGVNINARDIYDYTPLILASICGHYELVKLLLDYGAMAERNTFQGERCIYGALTLKIRKLLLSYDFSMSTDPLREWSEHINRLAGGSGPTAPDFALRLQDGTEVKVHRFLLAARSRVFRKHFIDNPALECYTAKSPGVPPESLYLTQQFLYMEQIPEAILKARSNKNDLLGDRISEGCEQLGNEYGLLGFMSILEAGSDVTGARKRHQEQINAAQNELFNFFDEYILKNKVITEEENLKNVQWGHVNQALADVMIKVECDDDLANTIHEIITTIGTNLKFGDPDNKKARLLAGEEAVDMPLKWVIYPVHKAMLCRSPYFATMFSSEFAEAKVSDGLHILTLDCAPATLEVLLCNLYTEKGEVSLAYSLDLLYTADQCMLPKLVNKAAVTISSQGMSTKNVWADRTHQNVTGTNADVNEAAAIDAGDDIDIYEIIHAAWKLGVVRLEQFAARFFAARLEDYVDTPKFAEIIKESAGRTQNRHETDTIELLDDIRHYLEERFRMRFQDVGAFLAKDQEQKKEILEEEERDKKNQTAIKTLSGEIVADEFVADDMNYQYLLQKIEDLLARLGLSA